jgi:cellulose synthase/poly-beta-1,6-N-acetylglucosamine synthase-like glycosyltransferase
MEVERRAPLIPDGEAADPEPREPLVSVVIPSYNSAAWIGAAVASAAAQSYRPAEIIVVDDGSSDDSLLVARSAGARTIAAPHAGRSSARNRGIRESRGAWVAFLDADDWWETSPCAARRAVRLPCGTTGGTFCSGTP